MHVVFSLNMKINYDIAGNGIQTQSTAYRLDTHTITNHTHTWTQSHPSTLAV